MNEVLVKQRAVDTARTAGNVDTILVAEVALRNAQAAANAAAAAASRQLPYPGAIVFPPN
jgi:hypothetical protein